MSSPFHKWAPNPTVLSREVAGEFVIYDPDRDAVHTLNDTARIVWENCDRSPQEIAKALCSQFEIAPDIAQRDIQRMLDRFKTQGLLLKTSDS